MSNKFHLLWTLVSRRNRESSKSFQEEYDNMMMSQYAGYNWVMTFNDNVILRNFCDSHQLLIVIYENDIVKNNGTASECLRNTSRS